MKYKTADCYGFIVIMSEDYKPLWIIDKDKQTLYKLF